jgi:hypothetical protein
VDIELVRNDLHRVRVVDADPIELDDGQARLRVDGFALTANNISYAVFGEMLRYWEVFPSAPPDPGEVLPWGRIPVWGFAEVVASRSPDLAVGERLYGYLPMSDELVITPGRADERGCSDVAPHRAGLAPAYNRYQRTAADPAYRADREDLHMLLYPLFFTGYLLDDLLADDTGADADAGLADARVVLTSASAKTAIATAFLAHRRGARVAGLTSAGNRTFVEGLGVYDEVHTYDEVDRLPPGLAVVVDIAGDRDVLHALHTRLGGDLAASLTVGGTHWDHRPGTAGDLPGPAPVFFFAPDRITKRSADWGRDGLDRRLGAAWDGFADWARGWLEVHPLAGPDAVVDAYRQLLDGRTDPRLGLVCTLEREGRDDG